MKIRFQIVVKGNVVLDETLESRNKFTALHELLSKCGITYNPTHFKEKFGWVQYTAENGVIHRTTNKFG